MSKTNIQLTNMLAIASIAYVTVLKEIIFFTKRISKPQKSYGFWGLLFLLTCLWCKLKKTPGVFAPINVVCSIFLSTSYQNKVLIAFDKRSLSPLKDQNAQFLPLTVC